MSQTDILVKKLESILGSHPYERLLSFLKSLTDEVYLVGGALRDSFLGKDIKDIDLTTPIAANELEEKLTKEKFRVIATGIEHGTLTVAIDGVNIEITTFREPSLREDSKYSDNIETDLSGRDFTINSIAYSIKSNKFIDPFNGIKDIEDKVLRATECPQSRLKEDPLRILRMLRFGPGYGFSIDNKTKEASKLISNELKNVSIERIREEFCEILKTDGIRNAFLKAKELNLLKEFIPEIIPTIDCEQNEFHTEDVFNHTLTVIERAPSNSLLLRLTALFHDLGKPISLTVDEDGRRHFYKHEIIGADITYKTMGKLKFSKNLTKRVAKLVEYHMRPLDCGPAAIRRLIRDLESDLENWYIFKWADKPPTMPDDEFEILYESFKAKWDEELEKAKGKPFGKLAINGNDLIKLGFKAGPAVGKVLMDLEEDVINNPENNTVEYLTKVAREELKK